MRREKEEAGSDALNASRISAILCVNDSLQAVLLMPLNRLRSYSAKRCHVFSFRMFANQERCLLFISEAKIRSF